MKVACHASHPLLVRDDCCERLLMQHFVRGVALLLSLEAPRQRKLALLHLQGDRSPLSSPFALVALHQR